MDSKNTNKKDTNTVEAIRLQKYLAEHGVASRRRAEQLITAGRVSVNGSIITELGSKVRPGTDVVCVDKERIGGTVQLRYILLNKPAGYICSAHDDRGRRTVLDLLDGVSERVYPVGRLDYDTAGLLLLTNDGDLTNQLLHPSHLVDKTYLAEVEGCPDRTDLDRLRRGIRLRDGMTAPARAQIVKRRDDSSWVELTIHEGRNRQVRRMMEAIGHPVKHLKRTRLAFLDIRELKTAEWRELSADEIHRLKQL